MVAMIRYPHTIPLLVTHAKSKEYLSVSSAAYILLCDMQRAARGLSWCPCAQTCAARLFEPLLRALAASIRQQGPV
eukprot:4409686-Pleurochrysis_carterae.AAC.5